MIQVSLGASPSFFIIERIRHAGHRESREWGISSGKTGYVALYRFLAAREQV
jgi:hypothetical protein